MHVMSRDVPIHIVSVANMEISANIGWSQYSHQNRYDNYIKIVFAMVKSHFTLCYTADKAGEIAVFYILEKKHYTARSHRNTCLTNIHCYNTYQQMIIVESYKKATMG